MQAPCLPASALLVRMEDVILRGHFDVARVAAVGDAGGVGAVGIRGRVVVDQRIAPAAAPGKALAVLLDHEGLREHVGHVDDERRLGALLELPLQLGDLGAFRERLAVAGNARLVGLDHDGIGHDHLQHLVGARAGYHRPVLVTPEVGEGDAAGRDQRVLVVRARRALGFLLRGKHGAAGDDEQERSGRGHEQMLHG